MKCRPMTDVMKVRSTKMRRAVPIGALILVLGTLAQPSPSAVYADETPGAASVDARVCKLMPVAELEQFLGEKATRVAGNDSDTVSVCTADFSADASAKLQYAKPGTPGVPKDVQTMLAVPRDMQSSGQQVSIKDFGDVGCYSAVVKLMGGQEYAASCGNPRGYLVLAVARTASAVPIDAVRKLLATAMSKL